MPGLLNDPEALDSGAPPPADPNAPDPAGGAPAPPADPNAAPEENGETVPDNEQGEQASPEEQARYEEFVKTGFDLMYKGGKVSPDIMKMLDDDPSDLTAVLDSPEELKQFSPVVALAATAAIITLKVCEKTGEKDGAIILHGGRAILDDLSQIALQAGIKEYSQDEVNQAMHMGADLFRHAAEPLGLVNADEAKQEWGQITAADKEGKLGQVIPQFAGVADQQQPPPQDQGAPPDGQS